MSDWQRGFELERLKALAAPFKARHKPLVFGAFGLTKERDIAEALAEGRAIWTGAPTEACALFSVLKHGSRQQDFAQRELELKPGSVFVKAFAALSARAGARLLRALRERAKAPCWLELFEEDEIAREAAAAAGFNYCATKIAAGSEVKGMYFTGPPPLPPLEAADEATLKICEPDFLKPSELAAIRAELEAFADYWAQHYSSYNKRKSWEAFALRGFADDPGFVIKPAEMSKAWKEENAERLAARPRMTEACEHFPATLAACARVAPAESCDRIRFMRLREKDGELARHADIVDKEAGTADGKLCRMHIPITTSPAVVFSGWSARGEHIRLSMPEGALCYLDQRKPHAAKNSDPELKRVHLVIDAHAGPELRARVGGAMRGARVPVAKGEPSEAVRVSAKCARLQFIKCGPDCLAAGCGGNCCDAPSRPSGCLVTIHPSEQAQIEARGGVVRGGLLQPAPGSRGCPFKSGGLCSLHGTPDKPFGCIASPFTLNRGGTLIVRNRYKMLPCYRLPGPRQPAYRAFAASLELLFGAEEAARLAEHFDRGGGDICAPMPKRFAEMLRANDEAKKALSPPSRAAEPARPQA